MLKPVTKQEYICDAKDCNRIISPNEGFIVEGCIYLIDLPENHKKRIVGKQVVSNNNDDEYNPRDYVFVDSLKYSSLHYCRSCLIDILYENK